MSFEIYAISEKGLREKNEDSFTLMEVEANEMDALVFCTCDGMGGHEGGAVASRIGCRAFSSSILGYLLEGEIREEAIRASIQEANSAVIRAQRSHETKNMGTTITAGVIAGRRMLIGNAGDTRCLIIRDSDIYVSTKDHSLAGLLAESGMTDIANISMFRSRLTSFLGMEDPKIYTNEVELEDRDVVLVGTDGLFEGICYEEIIGMIGKTDVSDPAKELCCASLEGGSHDNITVITIRMKNELTEAKTVKLEEVTRCL
jgi:protein phosphatase